MYVLQTPGTHHVLENSASLTGVTLLKSGRYNLRHSGSKKLNILPNGNLERIGKRSSNSTSRGKSKQRMPNVHTENISNNSCPDNNLPVVKKVRTYVLKKSLVRLRLLNFINAQKGEKELYFWTITFPPKLSDQLCYKYFNTWLTSLRIAKRLKNYLWVAERQAIGTIHFHIAIPHKMPVVYANKCMSIILANGVRKKEFDWNLQAAKKYNGVDIAKNRKTKRVTNFAVKKGKKSLVMYLTKYVTKNDTEFYTYCWHCSRDFSNLILKVAFTDKELNNTGWELYLNHEKLFESEYCIFIPWVAAPPPPLLKYFADVNGMLLSLNV
jgi:hypothetical protein